MLSYHSRAILEWVFNKKGITTPRVLSKLPLLQSPAGQNLKSSPSKIKMPAQLKQYKAAAVAAEPGWFDLELSVEKTIHWINEEGKAGCKLVAFPEVCSFPRLSDPCRCSLSLPSVLLRNPRTDPQLTLLDVEDELPTVSPISEFLTREQLAIRLR
jgi:hypothetical protein